MKHIFSTFLIALLFASCTSKPSEAERKEIEQLSGLRANELGAYQQERIAIEESIATTEQRVKDLKAGKYKISEEEVRTEIELAEQMLNDLKVKRKDVIDVIDKRRKEVDSLDLLLKK